MGGLVRNLKAQLLSREGSASPGATQFTPSCAIFYSKIGTYYLNYESSSHKAEDNLYRKGYTLLGHLALKDFLSRFVYIILA